MSLHYIDPNDTPRDCPRCKGVGQWIAINLQNGEPVDDDVGCSKCNGTGQLGNPDAPRFETTCRRSGRWYWRAVGDSWPIVWSPNDPPARLTEAEAIEAARKALGQPR